MEMYLEDRARMSAISLSGLGQVPPHISSTYANHSPPPPPPSTPVLASFPNMSSSGSLAKTKSILSDKQSSEPNTPIARNSDKQMTRGNSDLSQRFVKKRVTLRHSLDTTANRCSSAGTQRTVSEVQRTARSDSSIGGIMLSSATASAPAIKLETDIEANHTNAQQNDSRTTLFSSVDSAEPEIESLGTDVESLCVSDEMVADSTKDSDLEYIDDGAIGPAFSFRNSQDSFSGSTTREQLDRLLIPEMPDTGNESDCDSSQTTVIHAETQSLLSPVSSTGGQSPDSTKLHPKYHHHPHHGHHHSHHHYKTSSHHSTDNL